MIYDDVKEFIFSLYTEHGFANAGFANASNEQGNWRKIRDHAARLDIPNDRSLCIIYYYSRPDEVFFFVIKSNRTNRCPFDEFFELLPPEQKEVFLWNLHLLT
jgi:hypothetical protein